MANLSDLYSMDTFIDFDNDSYDFQWPTGAIHAGVDSFFSPCLPLGPLVEPLVEELSPPLLLPPSSEKRAPKPTDAFQPLLPIPPHAPGAEPYVRAKGPSASPGRAASHPSPPLGQQRPPTRSKRPYTRTSIEHRYRNSISLRLHELRCCVAGVDAANSDKPAPKPNKTSLLSNATEQITELSSTVAQQRQRIELLDRHIKSSQVLLEGLCGSSDGGEGDASIKGSKTKRLAPAPTLSDDAFVWIP